MPKKTPMPKMPPKLPPGAPPEANIAAATAAFAGKPLKMGDKLSEDKKQAPDSGKKEKLLPIPSAKKRLAQIKRSEKLRKPFIEDAERYFRMYQGDYSKKGRGKRRDDKMSVNIIYSHIEIVTPAIFAGFPALKVRPKPKTGESTAAAELRAESMELVINYWFKELGVDEVLRDVFLDTFFGPAFVELGWETEIDDRQQATETDDGGEVEGAEITTIKDRPFIVRREFRDITLDPDARARRDGAWIGVCEVIKWNDFQASSKFTDKAKKAIKPQLYPKSEDEKDGGDRPEDNSEKEWVRLYTIWDRDARKKYVITDNYPGFVNSDDEEGEDWPYEMEYKDDIFPICVHDAKRDRATPYSWSEFKAYEPQIVELNRIRQAMQIHVKTALPKYMHTDAIGEKQVVNKLMQAKSDESTLVQNLEAIIQLPIAEMPKDNYNMSEMSKEDLLDVSGLREYQGGISGGTATEVSIEEGRSKMRKTMRSKLWEQFVVEIGAKLAQLCQQNMDEEVAVEIAGPKGIEWMRVTKDQIQGEFFFDIEPGIMEYKNQALRLQQLLKFVELAANDENVNRRALISKVAKEMDISPEDIITPLDQMPKPETPEAKVKFKDIDPLAIKDPALMNALVLAACRQNGVDVGPVVDQLAGADRISGGSPMQQIIGMFKNANKQGGGTPGPGPIPPGGVAPNVKDGNGGAGSSGKDMAGNGASPNGNEGAAPVVGNLNPGGNPNG